METKVNHMHHFFETFVQCKADSINDVNLFYDQDKEVQNEVASGLIKNSTNWSIGNPYPILRCGVDPINFTYGEITFESILHLLSIAAIHKNDVFVDLGCGGGVCLAAATLMSVSDNQQQSFSRIIGIDLMRSKLLECKFLMDRIQKLVTDDQTIFNQNINDLSNDLIGDSNLDFIRNEIPSIEIYEYNFLKAPNEMKAEDTDSYVTKQSLINNSMNEDWALMCDVVYACATCFNYKTMELLLERFSIMKIGTRLILLDKTLELIVKDAFDGFEKNEQDNDRFAVMNKIIQKFNMLNEINCKTSWGEGIATIYLKIA
eukprot:gene6324-8709_t